MGGLTRDGTTEPFSRDQILKRERGQGNIHFSCSADHEQDWQPYPVGPYSCYMCHHTIHSLNILDYVLRGITRTPYRAICTLPDKGDFGVLGGPLRWVTPLEQFTRPPTMVTVLNVLNVMCCLCRCGCRCSFTLTDRASTILSNIRGCPSLAWSQRGTKVNGSRHGNNLPL